MKKYNSENLKNIQSIVERKAGVDITSGVNSGGYQIRKLTLLAGGLLCFVMLSAFAYAKFSDLNGDMAGFASVYQGNGRFEIVIVNDSDKELRLQNKVKVMQWSTGREVEGDSGKIKMSGEAVAPHSQGIVSIDLSEGYDVETMEENLQEKDWYYFVLTNNDFAFGQDWTCAFDFEIGQTQEVMAQAVSSMEERAEREREKAEEQQYDTGELFRSDWCWPTVSRNVSGRYGTQANGSYSDHVNIAGASGDDIYAVAGGIVTETAFDAAWGNYVTIDLGDGITVKYGALKEVKASVGDVVEQGEVIAELGKTGMATGPNLMFAVSIDGEEVDPFAE
ncbi:MAG: M23 family metallopeptidase [Butyrivibrio sp.]|nr:M23 family metallopeptidase [Muribaculum sp.]MCM1553247.1 M23 family metallopeptidase [Butyrivibrio sp.]